MTHADDTTSAQVMDFTRQAKHFCAFQERCSSEVSRKLSILGANQVQQQLVMNTLIEEGFLDNQRFANAFVQGKYKNNHWGRIKIVLELTQRDIPKEMIQQAISNIDDEAYMAILQNLIEKKKHALTSKNAQQIIEKTAYYCTGKGFEPELVWQVIKQTT